MLMNAFVLGADVVEGDYGFDSKTGERNTGFSVELTVVDLETKEKYDCRLIEGFEGLDRLKELRRQHQSLDVQRQEADQLRASLVPLVMSTLFLEVLKFTGKQAAYIKLVCRVAPAVV